MNIKNRKPKYAEREMYILDYLKAHKVATTDEICELLKVSPATVRRDFTSMSDKGLIVRSKGSIQLKSKPSLSSKNIGVLNEIDEEKLIIAKFASTFVKKGDCIFIGSGKTCNFFAGFIKNIEHLTVVTTNISIIPELVFCPNISLILLGGDVRAGTDFIETIPLDNEIEKYLGSFYFDKVFITVDGIELDCGYTIKNRKQIPLYTHLINASRDFFVFADSYKFNRHAFVPVFDINQIKNIITTNKIPSDYVDFYKSTGKNLFLVE